MDNETYGLANKSFNNEEKVSSYKGKLVNKFKSQMKKDYFYPNDPICICEIFKIFKLAYDTNEIYEKVTKWVSPQNV